MSSNVIVYLHEMINNGSITGLVDFYRNFYHQIKPEDI